MCCGNLIQRVIAIFTAAVVDNSNRELMLDLKDLVCLLRDVVKSSATMRHEIDKNIVDVFRFTSWCRLPFYEADFGWAMLGWVSKIHLLVEQNFLLDSEGGNSAGPRLNMQVPPKHSFYQFRPRHGLIIVSTILNVQLADAYLVDGKKRGCVTDVDCVTAVTNTRNP